MSSRETHPAQGENAMSFERHMRDLGLMVVRCAPDGVIGAVNSDDWMTQLFTRSALFADSIRTAAENWAAQGTPEIVQAVPGLWLAPMPRQERRQRSGYDILVIPTDDFVQSEQLQAMCQGASLDCQITRQLLRQLPPASASDVPRLANLARHTFESSHRIEVQEQEAEFIGDQLGETYEEISYLYAIIQNMRVVERPQRFITIACNDLLEIVPYSWIAVRFIDDEELLHDLSDEQIIVGAPACSAGDLRRIADLLLPTLSVDDAHVIVDPSQRPDLDDIDAIGRSAMGHAIIVDGRVIGVVIVGDKQGTDLAASSVDLQIVAATSTHMAIFLENAALYADLSAMFLGTLEAISASIDAKDRYTCGHSQRVALLTAQLARAVGLDEKTVDRMHIAGLVHDVGKIGVPENVLQKPGRLTDQEFDWIRRHPEMGHRILRDIPKFKDILPGVLHHHERWDGRGYPYGLSAEEIPLAGRLIALADSFDAMSSDRTYRARLSRGDVLREIRRCAGSQFDPALVPVFLGLDFSEFDRLVEEHQTRESTDREAA